MAMTNSRAFLAIPAHSLKGNRTTHNSDPGSRKGSGVHPQYIGKKPVTLLLLRGG